MDTICNESDEAILACDVSDEALETAASPTRDGTAAMSFPNAPTVSILIICCGNGWAVRYLIGAGLFTGLVFRGHKLPPHVRFCGRYWG